MIGKSDPQLLTIPRKKKRAPIARRVTFTMAHTYSAPLPVVSSSILKSRQTRSTSV